MDNNSISIKPYIKSYLELQRIVTLKELVHSPNFLFKIFVLHIWTCLQSLMKIQQWLFKILRKKNDTDGWTGVRTDGQRENSIPTTNKVCGGGGIMITCLINCINEPPQVEEPIRIQRVKFKICFLLLNQQILICSECSCETVRLSFQNTCFFKKADEIDNNYNFTCTLKVLSYLVLLENQNITHMLVNIFLAWHVGTISWLPWFNQWHI